MANTEGDQVHPGANTGNNPDGVEALDLKNAELPETKGIVIDQDDLHPRDGSADGNLSEGTIEAGADKLNPQSAEPLETDRFALDEEERLPWLLTPNDDKKRPVVDGARYLGVGLVSLIVLVALVGAIWFAMQRDNGTESMLIDGNSPPPKLATVNEAAPTPTASPMPAAQSSLVARSSPAVPMSGAGVQVGAFSTRAAADAAWTLLSGSQNSLSGLKHRVVEGRVDTGTVYRLQAVTTGATAARALCSTLKARGVACHIIR